MESLRFSSVFLVVPVVILVGLGFLSDSGQALRFDLQSGHTVCIGEEIKSEAMTVGKYSVVNPSDGHPLPESHKVNVKVLSPNHNKYNYHSADLVGEGQFSFHAVETGDYLTCITAAVHKPQTTITVDFEWKSGVIAKQWASVAKKGSVDAMEIELKQLFDTVQNIHSEMTYLRLREEEMQELNKVTNSRMAWMSFCSILICLMVAGLQFWHLKTFFEKKKVI